MHALRFILFILQLHLISAAINLSFQYPNEGDIITTNVKQGSAKVLVAWTFTADDKEELPVSFDIVLTQRFAHGEDGKAAAIDKGKEFEKRMTFSKDEFLRNFTTLYFPDRTMQPPPGEYIITIHLPTVPPRKFSGAQFKMREAFTLVASNPPPQDNPKTPSTTALTPVPIPKTTLSGNTITSKTIEGGGGLGGTKLPMPTDSLPPLPDAKGDGDKGPQKSSSSGINSDSPSKTPEPDALDTSGGKTANNPSESGIKPPTEHDGVSKALKLATGVLACALSISLIFALLLYHKRHMRVMRKTPLSPLPISAFNSPAKYDPTFSHRGSSLHRRAAVELRDGSSEPRNNTAHPRYSRIIELVNGEQMIEMGDGERRPELPVHNDVFELDAAPKSRNESNFGSRETTWNKDMETERTQSVDVPIYYISIKGRGLRPVRSASNGLYTDKDTNAGGWF